MKIICADRVSVGLSSDANFKWHMPICVEGCRAEQKYMSFFGTVTERAFRKKNSKPQEHIQMMQRCALDFFSAKRARWRSRVLDFFQDSRIRVKDLKPDIRLFEGIPEMAHYSLPMGHFAMMTITWSRCENGPFYCKRRQKNGPYWHLCVYSNTWPF